MLLKVFGWFLISLPFLVILATLIKEDGWKSVGKTVGAVLGIVACISIGAYLIFR